MFVGGPRRGHSCCWARGGGGGGGVGFGGGAADPLPLLLVRGGVVGVVHWTFTTIVQNVGHTLFLVGF